MFSYDRKINCCFQFKSQTLSLLFVKIFYSKSSSLREREYGLEVCNSYELKQFVILRIRPNLYASQFLLLSFQLDMRLELWEAFFSTAPFLASSINSSSRSFFALFSNWIIQVARNELNK